MLRVSPTLELDVEITAHPHQPNVWRAQLVGPGADDWLLTWADGPSLTTALDNLDEALRRYGRRPER